MKYKLDYKYGFPVIIHFFKGEEELCFTEIYKSGTLYSNLFRDFGVNYKVAQKILRITKRELIKQKIRTWFKCS